MILVIIVKCCWFSIHKSRELIFGHLKCFKDVVPAGVSALCSACFVAKQNVSLLLEMGIVGMLVRVMQLAGTFGR